MAYLCVGMKIGDMIEEMQIDDVTIEKHWIYDTDSVN